MDFPSLLMFFAQGASRNSSRKERSQHPDKPSRKLPYTILEIPENCRPNFLDQYRFRHREGRCERACERVSKTEAPIGPYSRICLGELGGRYCLSNVPAMERISARPFRSAVAAGLRWGDLFNAVPAALAAMNDDLTGFTPKVDHGGR